MGSVRLQSSLLVAFRAGRRQHGFTLQEALVTLTVTSVLAALGIPSLQSVLAQTRVTTAANTLLTALYTGRSEAITRNRRVVLCPSLNQRSCDGRSDWHAGYLLFVDDNANSSREDDEPIVRVLESPSLVSIRSSQYRDHVTYLPNGLAYGSNLSFALCSHDGRSGRAVIVANSGRARVATHLPDGRSPCAGR